MAPSVEKKIAELEMGLLHLQQNIDIPEINLPVNPVVAAVIKKYSIFFLLLFIFKKTANKKLYRDIVIVYSNDKGESATTQWVLILFSYNYMVIYDEFT